MWRGLLSMGMAVLAVGTAACGGMEDEEDVSLTPEADSEDGDSVNGSAKISCRVSDGRIVITDEESRELTYSAPTAPRVEGCYLQYYSGEKMCLNHIQYTYACYKGSWYCYAFGCDWYATGCC